MSDLYDQARRFLERVRPTPTRDDDGSPRRRRFEGLPYAVLEGPIALSLVGGDDGGDGGEEGGGGGGGCQYNLTGITPATCGELTILYGAPSCDPPYLEIPVDVSFEPFAVAWTGNTSFTCGAVTSNIYNIDGGELGSAGVWAGGTQPSESVSAVCSYTNATLFQYGILLVNVAITFVDGAPISLELNADGTEARVLYNSIEVIPWTALPDPITPGSVGALGASKGHRQTLSIADCRCD
jgi:hypothetical protein